MQYEPIEPGLFRLHSPAGPLLVPSSEEDLQAAGHVPLAAPGSGALALNDGAGGGPGVPGVPPSRLDAGGGIGGPGSGAGGSSAQNLDQDLFEGAPNAPEMVPRDERLTNPTRETRPLATEAPRGEKTEEKPAGTKTIKISVPKAGGSGGGGGGPRDMLVGYRVEKSGLKPEDVANAENAEADASIDRKLSAQNISERKASADTIQASRVGRYNREEENAIADQRARNEAMRADFAQRQSAIDAERKQVDDLKVNPREYFQSMPGWAKVLSAISVLAGGIQGGVNRTGQNPALQALNQEIERNIDSQKHNIALRRQGLAGKENELERLMKLYGSPEAAEAELRDRQRALVQSYAMQQALDSGATDAADNLRAQFADWDSQRAKNQLVLKEALAGKVEETHKMAYPGMGGGAAKPKHLSAGQEKVAGLVGVLNQIRSDIAGIPGETSSALPEEGNIAQRATKAAADFIGGKGTYEQNFRTAKENETTRKLQQAKTIAKGVLSQATGQGVITGPEQAPYENAIDSAHDAAGVQRAVDGVLNLIRANAGAIGAPDVTPDRVEEHPE